MKYDPPRNDLEDADTLCALSRLRKMKAYTAPKIVRAIPVDDFLVSRQTTARDTQPSRPHDDGEMEKPRGDSASYQALSDALKEEDLSVVFQPIVDLEAKKTFAVEALVRCKTPNLQSPPALFEHAVEHGYCGRLGRIIRHLTVQDCAGIPIFTNVHPEELTQQWIVRPDDPIFSHDEDVYLEITESVPFTHFDHCVSILQEMRNRGNVHLVIDDLGSGYSNLKRIIDLEPRIVKLDIELISGLDGDERQQRLVSSIVSMCSDQGAKVVAEGIETEDELRAVIDCGVPYGQGYLLARPANPIPESIWPLDKVAP